MKINNNTLTATVTELKHRIDVNTLAKLAAKTLALNEVGVCNLSTGARRSPSIPMRRTATTGAFILIDRYSNADGRRRHDRLCAAPRHQHPPPEPHRRARRRARR